MSGQLSAADVMAIAEKRWPMAVQPEVQGRVCHLRPEDLAAGRATRQTGRWALMVHCNQALALLDAMVRGRMLTELTKQRIYITFEMKLSFI